MPTLRADSPATHATHGLICVSGTGEPQATPAVRWPARQRAWVAGCVLLGAGWLLSGCDGERIHKLEEGVSTEAQVRQEFGEPERTWPEAGGARTLEYNRQPAGMRNYMITIGADGRMSALRQVLTPDTFSRIQPGMLQDDVRRLLGRPMRVIRYDWREQTEWDWRYLQPPATSMVFSVTFDDLGKVMGTGSTLDPQSEAQRAGG